ncbi:hypothetical protein VLK31_28260 [Variovorax sp. H27-G14]|uniref:hypothetical protein n=1 Tax=Variovorax sp. H27-G14 TaxID=3111914 RepID=UPI0038FCBD07
MATTQRPTALLTIESDGLLHRVLLPDGSELAGVTRADIELRPNECTVLRLEIARFNAAIKDEA